jgi:hypothetical protein
MQTHTEISRESHNLFSAEEVAETIGADLETVNEWLEVGAIDRAIFGGGQFSKYELHRAALVFELVNLAFRLPVRKTSLEKWNTTCNKSGEECWVTSKLTR